jgi:Bifunctional DNA primase/polymerase, N-terminal
VNARVRFSQSDRALAALQAAGRGWLIYPLRPRSKKPYIYPVAEYATSNLKTIKLWFDEVYCDADIGAVPPGHIVRIDIDRHRADRDGRATIAKWRSEGLILPRSLTCSTPRDGRHVYLRTSAAVMSGPLCPDGSVELKVGGVILPPSRGYRWLGYGEESIASLPDWAIAKWHDERQRRWHEHGRPPVITELEELLDLITRASGTPPRMRGTFGSFRCTAVDHPDRRASAWVRVDPPVIVGCSAGCAPAAILTGLRAIP